MIKSKNKKIILLILVFIILLILLSILIIKNNNNLILNINNKKAESNSTFSLESKEDNNVLLIFSSADGIKSIIYPNNYQLDCNGKKQVAIDYPIEKSKTYTFQITDVNNNTKSETFWVPSSHIEITKNDIDVDLDDIKTSMIQELNNNLIATNFIDIGTGVQTTVDSDSADMQDVFKNWSSFGDGNWSYNSSSKTILNSKNSDYFTGYYYPNGDYSDIDLSFNARTTDSDDDMIGAMIRFNANNSTSYSSYLFLLDRHDNATYKGIGNGAYNGINKVLNASLNSSGSGSLVKLSVDSSLRWKRSTWQNYRFIAKGNLLQAYIDNTLVAQVTDTSISNGTYGFVSFSQANTYFKDIVIRTNKIFTLMELLQDKNWNIEDINVVMNLNNSSETSLSDSNLVNSFNTNQTHYLGISNTSNKSSVETFLSKINNRGSWISSSDYDTYIADTVSYLISIYKN